MKSLLISLTFLILTLDSLLWKNIKKCWGVFICTEWAHAMEDSSLPARPQAVNLLKDLIFDVTYELSMGVLSNGFPGLAEKGVGGNIRPSDKAGICMLATREKEGYWRVRRIHVIKNNVKTGEWQPSKWPICNKGGFVPLRNIVREAGSRQITGLWVHMSTVYVSFHVKSSLFESSLT